MLCAARRVWHTAPVKKPTQTKPEAALFVTCLVDLMRPQVGFAAASLIEAAGFEVVVPKWQTCCGQPNYNSGDLRAARSMAGRTIEVLEPYKHVVVPSGSCAGMIKRHYPSLFDEADALFGKRTEVTSSNDRHANQEVNFLLQRLESYVGICILTTNHETAIDEAFGRRLSVHVRFAMPDLDERRRLWRAMLPSRAPRAPALGLDSLAEQFAMSGGYIRNAALRAAFMAADEDAAIGPHHLRRAAQLEYEAMGKLSPTAPTGSP